VLHCRFILNALRDDVAFRHGLEVDLLVGPHHAEGLLDAKAQRTAHAPRDVPAEGAQAANQRASSLRLALLGGLAGLEGRGTQLHQLPLGGVVGSLQRLGAVGSVPQRGAQA
jgi:hypothetical protein